MSDSRPNSALGWQRPSSREAPMSWGRWSATEVAEPNSDVEIPRVHSPVSESSLSDMITQVPEEDDDDPFDGFDPSESSRGLPTLFRYDEDQDYLPYEDQRYRPVVCTEEGFQQIAMETVMFGVDSAIRLHLHVSQEDSNVRQIRARSWASFRRSANTVRVSLNPLPGRTAGIVFATAQESFFVGRSQVLGVRHTFARVAETIRRVTDHANQVAIDDTQISVWTTVEYKNGAWELYSHSNAQECTCDHDSPDSCLAAERAAQNQTNASQETRTMQTALSSTS